MTTGPVRARRWAVAFVPALLLAGCLGAGAPARHAAGYARLIASSKGVTLDSVHCSRRGDVAWTCTGRTRSGQEYTCSVSLPGRVSPSGECKPASRP
jgi:hypothetical protein